MSRAYRVLEFGSKAKSKGGGIFRRAPGYLALGAWTPQTPIKMPCGALCWWGTRALDHDKKLITDLLMLVGQLGELLFGPIQCPAFFFSNSPTDSIPIPIPTYPFIFFSLDFSNLNISCIHYPHHGTYHQWGSRPKETNCSHDKWGRFTWNEWLSTRRRPNGYRPRL